MNEYQIKGWFFTTIKNRNIDNIRKLNRILYLETEDMLEEESEGFEESIVVNELLAQLPEKDRQVLTLRYNMNLNSREIGEVLGISPSTVRSRISSALKILRKKL